MSPKELLTPDGWRNFPVLTRADLRDNLKTIMPRQPLPLLGEPRPMETSGSSGSPLVVMTDDMAQSVWMAHMLRLMKLYGYDIKKTMVSCKYEGPGREIQLRHNWGWGNMKTGRSYLVSPTLPVSEIVKLLRRVKCPYLFANPSLMHEIALYCQRHQYKLPFLERLRTTGEVLSPKTRNLAAEVWQLPVIDTYTTQEVGHVAYQSPAEPNLYYIADELAYVEILNDQNEVCQEGEIGRVVVTPRYNFSSPLIRYELGDMAEAGPPGIYGPMIRRIIGRVCGMFTRPDGEAIWPVMDGKVDGEAVLALPVDHYQAIQLDHHTVKFRVAGPRPFSAEEEETAKQSLYRGIGFEPAVHFEYVERIERSAGGKFEEFKSLVPVGQPFESSAV